MKKDDQILKSRDDKGPIFFSRQTAVSGAEESFTLTDGSVCSWLQDKDAAIGREPMLKRVVAAHIARQGIGLARADDGLHDAPDRLAVVRRRGAYRNRHSYSAAGLWR